MDKHINLFIALMVILLAGCVNKEVETEKIKEAEEMKETVIEIPFANYNHPVIQGDEMFVPINRNTSDSFDVDTLIQYNIDNGDREVLYESEYDESSMQATQVNEDWLIWVDSSSDGYYEKILSMERSSGKIQTLAETNPKYLTILSPELYHEYVAWTQLVDDGITVEVKLHNLITNETISVAKMNDYSLYNAFVHIEDNKLLWTDTEDGQGYYILYDIESKSTENYKAPKTFPGYATYSNGKIFSINFDDDRNWTSQEFGYLDIATNEYHTFEHESTLIILIHSPIK
ncbi:hypothetical protein [Sporosarcina jiandibaonis]|uniref:hypothetical protein n=1 Tax=Sporosarcina jiandibaonis TaxID=2715535 RepID=UPI001555409F|nr:hypothetical protein [Sporosarcina jiandibaonis]